MQSKFVAVPLLLAFGLLAGLSPDAVGGDRWPGFRGAGDSRSDAVDLPLRWSDDQNVAWRTTLAGVGQSSPVIADGRIYVTSVEGPDKDNYHLHCLGQTDGKVLWKRTIPASQRVKLTNMVSQASATPVVGEAGVYALLDTGDIVAFMHDGEPLWTRRLAADYGPLVNNHGLGTSPVLVGDKLLVLVAQGERSYLAALDAKSGKTLWKTDQELPTGWSTPAVADVGGRKLVIVSTSGVVVAFDLQTGKHLWTLDGFKGNTVPSPTIAGDIAYIGANETGEQVALRLSADGEPKVLWRTAEAACSFGSPLLLDGRLYFTNKVGVAQCLDAATGKLIWKERLPASCWASPIGVGDRVYFFCNNGATVVVKAGDTFEPLAESTLKVEGRLYGVAAVDGGFAVRSQDEVIWISVGAHGRVPDIDGTQVAVKRGHRQTNLRGPNASNRARGP